MTVYNITIRILSKLQRYIHSRLYFADINIYPIQFAFHSKDAYMTEGKPVHNQDLGYIRVLSSMKKQAFWGQPSTQMLECGRNGKVSIKDLRPSQHESVSSGNCHYYRV